MPTSAKIEPAPSSSPQRIWRPLHEALTWIITRNVVDTEAAAILSEAQFKEFHFPERKPDGSLLTDNELAVLGRAALKRMKQAARNRFKDGIAPAIKANKPCRELISRQAAWELLCQMAYDGHVQLHGRLVQRRLEIEPYEAGVRRIAHRTDQTSADQTEIQPLKIHGYKLWDSAPGQEIWLEPKGCGIYQSQPAKGLFWKDVTVNWPELLSAFPAAQDVKSETVPANSARIKSSRQGQGSFAQIDEPLLIAMAKLLADGKAASPEAAAKQVASKAHGAGSQESKVERLATRYRKSKNGN